MNPIDSNPRRRFVAHLASGTAALGALVVAPRLSTAREVAELPGSVPHELDAWIAELKGEYRIVLDSVSPKGATELTGYAQTYLGVNRGPYAFAADKTSLVAIVRNMAAAFGFNDEAWAKFTLGELAPFDDPRSGAKAQRNVAANAMASIVAQGGVIAVCGMATQYYAGLVAQKHGISQADARKELEARLLNGARIVPSGITAVDRCQRERFSYAYVG